MNINDQTINVLHVIDMQNGFIDGTLPNPRAAEIIPAVIAEIEAWDGIVVATRDTHDPSNYADSVEGRALPIHCVKNTPDWEIEPRIMAALRKKNAVIVDKTNFGHIDWPKALFDIDSTNQEAVAALTAGKNIRIRYTGTCTDICLISQVAIERAWFPDAKMEIVDGATAALCITREGEQVKQAAALEVAKSLFCDVVPTVYDGGTK